MERKSKMRLGIWGTALSAAVACSPSQQSERDEKELPNVILIYLDDMGSGDFTRRPGTIYY